MSTVYLSSVRARGGAGRPGIAAPLCVAGLCVLALALTWLMSSHVQATRYRDAVALYDFTQLRHLHLNAAPKALVHLLDPVPFIAVAVALVAVAIVRRRLPAALAVAVVMILAPLTSELLKPLLAHPHYWVPWTYVAEASWPSGHATAAAALAWCAVLVSPSRLRPRVAALGVLFAASVGCSLLILGWHMPSDVLGGYLIASLWVSLAVAGMRAWTARSHARQLRTDRRLAGAPAASARAGGVRAGIP